MPENSKSKKTTKTTNARKSTSTGTRKTTNASAKKASTAKTNTAKKTTDEVKSTIQIGSEAIRTEAKSTVNDVKETIRNVDIKSDAKVTTNFVSSMLKNPLETLRRIANDNKYTALKHAIILIILWSLAVLINSIFGTHWVFRYVASNILSVIKAVIAPVLGLICLSVVVYFLQGSRKKSLTTIFTTVTIASTPIILVAVLSILQIFSSNFTSIITPLGYFGTTISIVFMYFSLKAIIGAEENSKFIKSFMLIQGFYFLLYFVLTFLGIYIPTI